MFLTLGGIIFTWLLWLAIGGHLWLFLRANNRLSVIAHDPINDDYGIYLYNIDDLQRITPLGIRPTYHKWAPDGKNIAFIYVDSISSTETHIGLINVETLEFQHLHSIESGSSYFDRMYYPTLAWSPDAKKILFTKLITLQPMVYQLYLLDIAAQVSEPTQIFYGGTPKQNLVGITVSWAPGDLALTEVSYDDEFGDRHAKVFLINEDFSDDSYIVDAIQAQWVQGNESIIITLVDEHGWTLGTYRYSVDTQKTQLITHKVSQGTWTYDGGFSISHAGGILGDFPPRIMIYNSTMNRTYEFVSHPWPASRLISFAWAP